MTELRCKHCGSGSFVRNGMANGHQRYRCKACGRSFTQTPARGKPPAMKALAVLLYALGNVSQGMIAKLLGVSHVAVYKWVRAAGEEAPAPSASRSRSDHIPTSPSSHRAQRDKPFWGMPVYGLLKPRAGTPRTHQTPAFPSASTGCTIVVSALN